VAGGGSVEYVEWPAEKRAIDIGSFYADSGKFTAASGWMPQVHLEEGLRRTLAFYREHYAHYVEDDPQAREGVQV
jgi:UDP-glucose 4-epimerase